MPNSNTDDIKNCLVDIVSYVLPHESELAETLSLQQKLIEKYGEYLPETLLTEGYGRKVFNSKAAKQWILDSFFKMLMKKLYNKVRVLN